MTGRPIFHVVTRDGYYGRDEVVSLAPRRRSWLGLIIVAATVLLAAVLCLLWPVGVGT